MDGKIFSGDVLSIFVFGQYPTYVSWQVYRNLNHVQLVYGTVHR